MEKPKIKGPMIWRMGEDVLKIKEKPIKKKQVRKSLTVRTIISNVYEHFNLPFGDPNITQDDYDEKEQEIEEILYNYYKNKKSLKEFEGYIERSGDKELYNMFYEIIRMYKKRI
jgi:hypothetical protein